MWRRKDFSRGTIKYVLEHRTCQFCTLLPFRWFYLMYGSFISDTAKAAKHWPPPGWELFCWPRWTGNWYGGDELTIQRGWVIIISPQAHVCRGKDLLSTGTIKHLHSLRSKRFQSSYCAKVRAEAKKKGWRPSFLDEPREETLATQASTYKRTALACLIIKELKQQRQRRLQKRHLKSEFAPLQTLSRLFHLV